MLITCYLLILGRSGTSRFKNPEMSTPYYEGMYELKNNIEAIGPLLSAQTHTGFASSERWVKMPEKLTPLVRQWALAAMLLQSQLRSTPVPNRLILGGAFAQKAIHNRVRKS